MTHADTSSGHSDHGTRPLVTVVTPTLNSSLYLRETLTSIANQTYPSIEHIVVDGGSTDDTLRIVAEFPRVRCISGADSGMYDAINNGLKASNGTFVAYLNSDDLYFHDTVERVVDYFGHNAGVDLVFGNCVYIDEYGASLFTRKYPSFNWKLYSVLDGSTMPQQSCFWRRSLMDRSGYFDTTFRMAGDFEFFIRAGREFAVGKVDGRPLAQFRFHERMQTLNRVEVNNAEIKRIHALYPVGRNWSLPVLRFVARVRYMSVNAHRIADKVKDRLAGRRNRFRP